MSLDCLNLDYTFSRGCAKTPSIERLKQSRITLTHILLFGLLLCGGSALALDVDKAFSFHERLNRIEYRLQP